MADDFPTEKKTQKHNSGVWCCALSPDGLHVATGTNGGLLSLWPLFDTVEPPSQAHLLAPSSDGVSLGKSQRAAVRALWFVPQFNCLMAGNNNGVVNLFSLIKDSRNQRLTLYTEPLARFQVTDSFIIKRFIPLGDLQVLIAGSNGSLDIWRVAEEETTSDPEAATADQKDAGLAGHVGPSLHGSNIEVRHVAKCANNVSSMYLCGETSDDLLRVVVGTGNTGTAANRVEIWDMTTRKRVRVMEGHTSSVLSVGFVSPYRVVSGSFDNSVKLWDVESGACVFSLSLKSGSALRRLDDGRSFVMGDFAGGMHIISCDERDGSGVGAGYHPSTSSSSSSSSSLFSPYSVSKEDHTALVSALSKMSVKGARQKEQQPHKEISPKATAKSSSRTHTVVEGMFMQLLLATTRAHGSSFGSHNQAVRCVVHGSSFGSHNQAVRCVVFHPGTGVMVSCADDRKVIVYNCLPPSVEYLAGLSDRAELQHDLFTVTGYRPLVHIIYSYLSLFPPPLTLRK